jgi:hypothetical protein
MILNLEFNFHFKNRKKLLDIFYIIDNALNTKQTNTNYYLFVEAIAKANAKRQLMTKTLYPKRPEAEGARSRCL